MRIMGILNLTPDSFFDGGSFVCADTAVSHARTMVASGADLVDVGAESSRPGSEPVDAVTELDRLRPVLKRLHTENIPFSVDTYKPEVQLEAIRLGASMINDIMGGSDDLFRAAEKARVSLCLMHTPAAPKVMMQHAQYEDVLSEVCSYFEKKAMLFRCFDLPEVLLDPGIGFGKTMDQNLRLLEGIHRLRVIGDGILLGVSRKSLIKDIMRNPDLGPKQRLPGSLALAVLAWQKGVDVLRVHDVAETKQALAAAKAWKSPASGRMQMHLDQIQVMARLGVNAEEQQEPQLVLVSLHIKADFDQVVRSDQLAELDYVKVCQSVRDFAIKDHIGTLEAFVQRLSRHLLHEFSLVGLKIRVDKPRYCDALSVGCISFEGEFGN